MPRKLSPNSQIAIAEGLKPGTTAYDNRMRSLQRYAKTEGKEQRKASAAELAKIAKVSPAQAQRLVRVQEIRDNRKVVSKAGTPQPGQRAKITAKMVVGNSAAEQRRGHSARTVTSAPLTPETIALLKDDPRAFLNADFFGLDADDADGYGVEAAQVISVSYI